MKYRIKDPKKQELVKELFGIESFCSNFTDTELRADLSFAGRYLATNRLPVEQVQELAEGWNPYPQSKPQKNGKYLIAIGEGDLCFVGIGNFAGKSFAAWNPDIIAWREMPKIWKEMEK